MSHCTFCTAKGASFQRLQRRSLLIGTREERNVEHTLLIGGHHVYIRFWRLSYLVTLRAYSQSVDVVALKNHQRYSIIRSVKAFAASTNEERKQEINLYSQ